MAGLNKNKSIGELFEGIDLTDYSPEKIRDSKKVYNYIVESAELAKQENLPLGDVIDEGVLSGLIGGAISATVGKSIMEGICKALGVNKNSVLWNTLTSRLVLSAVGYELGYNW